MLKSCIRMRQQELDTTMLLKSHPVCFYHCLDMYFQSVLYEIKYSAFEVLKLFKNLCLVEMFINPFPYLKKRSAANDKKKRQTCGVIF